MLLVMQTISVIQYQLYSQVDIVLHQPHSGVAWPALLVVIPHDVLVVWVRMFCQISLYQVTCLVC